MRAEERRAEIVSILTEAQEAVPGGVLSQRTGVSRQIIVQDIAALKAAGHDIVATHRGYVLKVAPMAERVFKVRHNREQTEEELTCIVELGGTVVNVFVWHKVYGRIEATLNIFSKRGVQQLVESVNHGRSTELMQITDGYHYHTVRAESEQVLDHIEGELRGRGYIVPEK